MSKKFPIYPERESKSLEFKSKLPEFSKLIKTCVAFANGAGGQILIGIEDESKKIIGVEDKDRDRLYDEFPNSLYDSVSPTLIAQIYEKRIEDFSILIIQIPQCPKKPYFIKTEGLPKGVYVRVGSNTRRASSDYIEDLVREGSRVNFDEEAISEDISIFSRELLHQFYEKEVRVQRLIADKIAVLSNATRDSYHPTVTGVLFFCDKPHEYIPEASIICTFFRGKSGREIIQTQELFGPVDKLAADAFQLVLSWLIRDYEMKGVRLKGKCPIPEEALREAIVNALIHRKYTIPGSVKIALYEDHLDILSPGCFPGLVDLENLGDGTTFLRNPHVARIAHRMGLVEKLGSGIRLIFDSCKKAGLMQPEYREGNDTVKITFFFSKYVSLNQSIADPILSLLRKSNEITIPQVMKHLHVSRNTATRKLNELCLKKILIRTGKGPSVRYVKLSSKK